MLRMARQPLAFGPAGGRSRRHVFWRVFGRPSRGGPADGVEPIAVEDADRRDSRIARLSRAGDFAVAIWAGGRIRDTLEEVGKIFSVTRERVRQIENKAVRLLQHPSRSQRLAAFVERPIAVPLADLDSELHPDGKRLDEPTFCCVRRSPKTQSALLDAPGNMPYNGRHGCRLRNAIEQRPAMGAAGG